MENVIMDTSSSSGTLFSNKVYNVLKFVALVVLPAVGTLYFALAGIWDLPKANEIVGSITAIDTFLGLVLHLATNQYNKSDVKYDGSIVVDAPADGPKRLTLEFENDDDAMHLDQKETVTFRIKTNTK